MPSRRLAVAVLYLACVCLACAEPLEPTALPPGAQPFEPEPVFEEWWRQIEDCSERRGEYSAIQWYFVPGEDPFVAPPLGREVIGYWDPSGNRIVLLEYVPNRSALVRHEILHALLRRGNHPAEYFEELCGPVINGPGLNPD